MWKIWEMNRNNYLID